MLVLSADSGLRKDTAAIKSHISFLPFYHFIREKVRHLQGRKTRFLEYVISQLEQRPELLQPVEDEQLLETHKDLVELVASAIFPATTDEHTTFYSFSTPYLFRTFYYSDVFGAYFTKEQDGQTHLHFPDDVSQEKIRQENISLAYKFIIRKFYNFDLNVDADLVYQVTDPFSGLKRYGKVQADDRFVDVHLEGVLPPFEMKSICPKTYRILDCDKLQAELPLSLFRFEGFLVRNIIDTTSTAFADEIKDAILTSDAANDMEVYFKLTESVKGLVELKNADVHFIPILNVNSRMEMPKKADITGKILSGIVNSVNATDKYRQFTDYFITHGEAILLQDIAAQAPMYDLSFLEVFRNQPGSLLLFPVYGDRKLLGLVEIFSEKPNAVTLTTQNRLGMAYPLLAMAFQRYHDRIEQDINVVMKNEFTAIQPSVEWKFVEVAWNHIQNRLMDAEAPLGPINFREVYPIYGAVDIRNSSTERASAISKDVSAQLHLTESTFAELQKITRLPILDGFQFRLRQLAERIAGETTTAETETEINDFLEGDIKAAFNHFSEVDARAATMVKEYYHRQADLDGPLHTHRRHFDESLARINKTISQLLEEQQEKIQQSYPHYFEKYRSDGIEYNIYIGQSLSPQKKFDWIYLKNLRLWQLGAMADIAMATHHLVKKLPHALHTTQLILAHHHPIDISFRKDERKFDVEGAYNIRYEVVKKRLDKALVKGTGERLTQPGKIAIVYTHASEADEYLQYIQFLQHTGKLEAGHEMLEIDNLQGVNGLRAIRVNIKLD
jgi:hypothetical protein